MNFGMKEFAFEVSVIEKLRQSMESKEVSSIPIDFLLLGDIVKNYLFHEGFAKTYSFLDPNNVNKDFKLRCGMYIYI